MVIRLKRKHHIEAMRAAGRITGNTLNMLRTLVRPGITTGELDRLAEAYIRSQGAEPSFKGLYGYPASICTSVNDEVIHGIPGSRVLRKGDIISIDVGVHIKGFHGDAARTFPVGRVSPEAHRLIDVTRDSFFRGAEHAVDGGYLNDVSGAVQNYAEEHDFSVVRDYYGHGIGRSLHEDPLVPNFASGRPGPLLRSGMTIALEPMVNAGSYEVKTLSDDWTVVTADGSLSAHYENTLLITDGDKPELLTLGDA